jgi:hypothetical protein
MSSRFAANAEFMGSKLAAPAAAVAASNSRRVGDGNVADMSFSCPLGSMAQSCRHFPYFATHLCEQADHING